jgi:hypothetical protein
MVRSRVAGYRLESYGVCKNCKSSEIGIQRQAELDAATEACKALNINPATVGFLVRHAYQGRVPPGQRLNATPEQIKAVERHNAASGAMKKLHEDYVWDRGRKHVEEMKARGVQPFYIAHGDKH